MDVVQAFSPLQVWSGARLCSSTSIETACVSSRTALSLRAVCHHVYMPHRRDCLSKWPLPGTSCKHSQTSNAPSTCPSSRSWSYVSHRLPDNLYTVPHLPAHLFPPRTSTSDLHASSVCLAHSYGSNNSLPSTVHSPSIRCLHLYPRLDLATIY
jgi:hypothetical protein